MLARPAVQIQEAGLLGDRCKETKEMLLRNSSDPVTCPRDERSDPGPPRWVAPLGRPLRASCLFPLADKLITKGIKLRFSVPVTIMNGWAKKQHRPPTDSGERQ